ncbi:uncharacterized protein HMPREF1541_00134 [Cyphellophora europaea CBS 101466]|uniref:Homeobox domain-containing protein n=1 Tax=Cyphellophora europaea (strain CBS 101466) TaxID=1220924 RepID=W2SB81_CYPE1|nr:uncharacterized protein HMPREF1541_00134 [Cyphellophora europaea CBS 101466]ETN45952.1 hypothetical protein HMPREF1541_00134 [Cyphellophora europaea CBS 101466]
MKNATSLFSHLPEVQDATNNDTMNEAVSPTLLMSRDARNQAEDNAGNAQLDGGSSAPDNVAVLGTDVSRSRLSRQQRNALQTWIQSHVDWPYPRSGERKQLATDNGLLESQVTTFFANYRRRRMRKTGSNEANVLTGSSVASPSSPQVLDGHEVSSSTLESLFPDAEDGSRLKLLDFDGDRLQWYLACLPDHSEQPLPRVYPIPMTSVIDANPKVDNIMPMEGLLLESQLESSTSAEPSAAGSAYSRSASVNSRPGSVYSARSSISNVSRRGRRAYGVGPRPPSASPDGKQKRHRCLHCAKRFARPFTLKRHMKTVHLTTNTVWICQALRNIFDNTPCCPTCYRSPEQCTHKVLQCWKRPEAERTFLRKDEMKQHLDLMHDFTRDHAQRWQTNNDILGQLKQETAAVPYTGSSDDSQSEDSHYGDPSLAEQAIRDTGDHVRLAGTHSMDMDMDTHVVLEHNDDDGKSGVASSLITYHTWSANTKDVVAARIAPLQTRAETSERIAELGTFVKEHSGAPPSPPPYPGLPQRFTAKGRVMYRSVDSAREELEFWRRVLSINRVVAAFEYADAPWSADAPWLAL